MGSTLTNAHGRIALVTGAASGMGRSTVEALVRTGWDVIALDVVPAESAPDGAGPVRSVVADIRSRAAIEAALSTALADHERISLVANIAGVYPPTTLDDYDDERFRRVFDINVLGTVNVTAAASPHLAADAAVVNFASADAFTVSPGQLLYGASKAAVVMLTKSLALELAPRGIRVNAIAPGWVATPGNAATGRMAAASAGIPLGRVAQPEEIAEWVLLLGDPARAGFMTGETVVLAGGDVMR